MVTIKNARVVTVLPLLRLKSLAVASSIERLFNGYRIVKRNSILALSDFEKGPITKRIAANDLSSALNAEHFLAVTAAEPLPPAGTDLKDFWNKLPDRNSEKIDRMLLALNLINRVWTFRPDVRFSWNESRYPVPHQNIHYRHHYPIAVGSQEPQLSDFHEAAKLTRLLDEIYAANESHNSYPGLRVALDALRSGMYAYASSIRYLQEAIVLETLTSTENQEVTHRVRLTAALLLTSEPDVRSSLYEQVGEIYKTRSKIIHGSTNAATREELIKIEQLARRILRRVLQRRILSKYIDRKTQRQFLLDLQLGYKGKR